MPAPRNRGHGVPVCCYFTFAKVGDQRPEISVAESLDVLIRNFENHSDILGNGAGKAQSGIAGAIGCGRGGARIRPAAPTSSGFDCRGAVKSPPLLGMKECAARLVFTNWSLDRQRHLLQCFSPLLYARRVSVHLILHVLMRMS